MTTILVNIISLGEWKWWWWKLMEGNDDKSQIFLDLHIRDFLALESHASWILGFYWLSAVIQEWRQQLKYFLLKNTNTEVDSIYRGIRVREHW
jgi:hypothetical protein